jgi:hypothetical protein
MARKGRYRGTPSEEERENYLGEKLALKGMEGCMWRWLMIGASAKNAYREAVEKGDHEEGYLEEQETLMNLITTAVVIQVPSLGYYEAYKHCQQIATRDLIVTFRENLDRATGDDKLDALLNSLPPGSTPMTQFNTIMGFIKQFDEQHPEENFLEKFMQRCEEWLADYPWHLHSEDTNRASLFLYDEPITHLPLDDGDLTLQTVYKEDQPVSLVGHMAHKDWVVALLFSADATGLGRAGLRPFVEWRATDEGHTPWVPPYAYTGRILDRFIERCGVPDAFVQRSGKLSFKRKLQKVRKTLGAVWPQSKHNLITWYELKTRGIDMFTDVAIRRGYVDKDKEAKEINALLDHDSPTAVDLRGGRGAVRIRDDSGTVLMNIDHGHRAIVERFMATRQHQEALAQAESQEPEFRSFGKEINHLLRQARIIEIPWKFYWKQLELAFVNAHNRALLEWEEDEYLSEDWISLTENLRQLKSVDKEMHDEIAVMTMREMQRMAWEPEMPFPICWLGYDTPIGGTITMTHGGDQDYFSECYRLGANIDPKVDGLPYLYGHLLTKTNVYAFFTLIVSDRRGGFTPTHKAFALMERESGEWNHPAACSSLTLANIVRFIEEHQVVIEQSPALRKTNDRIARRISKAQRRKVEPPPYYTVYIKDGVYDVKKQPVNEGVRGPLTYSHDRAGGTYYKVRRGSLPLDSKEKTKLERRKYVVFEHEKPYGEWAEAIKKRGARAKGPDEWIAILKWRRRDTVVRPDLPKYIPSVRRSEKHKERRKDCA